MKTITIVTPVYNEIETLDYYFDEISKITKNISNYKINNLIIDNCSNDGTTEYLRKKAKKNKNLKLIINNKNYGHIKSHYYALTQSNSDASVLLYADLQDPIKLIYDFISEWEKGAKIVIGIKKQSKENNFIFFLRKFFYKIINFLSDENLIENYNGFGLYDKVVLRQLSNYKEPFPYFRGLIAEIGYKKSFIDYVQEKRMYGKTKNNLFILIDFAIIALINHTKFLVRLMTLSGLFLSILFLIIGTYYLVYKIIYWNSFSLGLAPLVVGLLFSMSFVIFFIGIIGEYVYSINEKLKNKPLVIEEERINF